MQMFAVQLLLSVGDGDGLAVRHGLLGILCVLIKIHVHASSGRPPQAGASSCFSFRYL